MQPNDNDLNGIRQLFDDDDAHDDNVVALDYDDDVDDGRRFHHLWVF